MEEKKNFGGGKEEYWWKRKGNWDMEKLGGGEEEIWRRTEGDKVWSLLLAHFQPFFQLSACILTIFDKKIPYFNVSRQKRVLFNCFATKQCLGMLKM